MIQNYQIILDKEIEKIKSSGAVPKLLLHSCCAPCSSYVLEYLSNYFEITVFYYNPNISPQKEFIHRAEEQKRLIDQMPFLNPVKAIIGKYDNERYNEAVSGHETDLEGGERCTICYRMRLEETAKAAADNNFDYFTTTLSISPMKDAKRLNSIGESLSEKYGVKYLYSDFKKKDGYKRSCVLSAQYGLYRQNYCGCVFSAREAAKRTEK